MFMFTLAISCLATSSLPWFMDLTFQVPIPYCSLQHQTFLLSAVTHPQLGVVIALAPSRHSFWSYLSTHLQYHTGYLPTWGVHLSVSYLFGFSSCSCGFQDENTEVVCHSLFQWTMFCHNCPPWPNHLGWPCTAWLSFTELDKPVVHEIWLVSFPWLLLQSVCRLMPSLSAYCLTGFSLTLAVGYLFMTAKSKWSGKHALCGAGAASGSWKTILIYNW